LFKNSHAPNSTTTKMCSVNVAVFKSLEEQVKTKLLLIHIIIKYKFKKMLHATR